jgi:transposase
MARNRRKFSREFKMEAIRLAREGDRPVSHVARELGVRPDLLSAWIRQAEAAGEASRAGTVLDKDEEIRRLRRELEMTKQERDFLKKATAYFARDVR